MEDLRGRRVVAVVAGNGKAKAILGALRTGILTDLVVSEPAARSIAEAVGGDTVPLREVGT
jgi:DNA-binding transcriptional regulator LsrR (DeoR family)